MLCTAHGVTHLTKLKQGDGSIMKNAAALCITGRVVDGRICIYAASSVLSMVVIIT